jgi:hypothetical protein
VVKARVRARLLRLQLLTIDAEIVIGRPGALAGPRAAPGPVMDGTLVDAVRLLDEGDRRLIEVGSLRARLSNNSGRRAKGGRRSPRRTPST